MRLNRRDSFRIGLVLAMIFAIAMLHNLTGNEASPYYGIICRLYYFPIVLAGVWFHLKGGVGSALLVSVIFAPHAMFQWGRAPGVGPEQYFEVLLFNLTGFVSGFFAAKLDHQRRKTQKSLSDLEASYSKLREQADLIIEIEDQLRQADRLTALGELSAGMAHEIRNPLGSIRGTAEILRDALPDDHRFSEFASILVNEADRLNRVVRDFLDFARPGPAQQSSFEINRVLDETLTLSRQQARKNRVSIHWEKSELPVTIGAADQFKQVFLNLILNALQVMPDGGDLWIDTERGGNSEVVVSFRDSGPGIPEEELDKVFNPFFTTKAEGTGLGLAITYRIVQNHCGRIRAQNSAGGGAVFVVTLKTADQPCSDGEVDVPEDSSH